jgi:hypothetical protein
MFDDIIEINGNKLTSKYIESLSKQQRLDLIDPIFTIVRNTGWLYPDNPTPLKKEYQKLVDTNMDLNTDTLFNNSSLATDICKYFCKSFYSVTEVGKPNMIEIFNDDVKLKKVIWNRLGLDWLEDDTKKGVFRPGVNEAFNLSFRMIIQGMRSMRLVNSTSIFKPNIAKYMCQKYSEPGDTVYDYSAGYGGRLLGAVSCGRKYIAIDPTTAKEVNDMINYLGLKDCQVFDNVSENFKLDENSIGFSYSSPPYGSIEETKEQFSRSDRDASNKDANYFYDVYWKQTLENVKYMLKPNKYFGLNITDNYTRMIDMAKQHFGDPVEIVKLRTVRSHLTKSKGVEKFEPIFMFKNIK